MQRDRINVFHKFAQKRSLVADVLKSHLYLQVDEQHIFERDVRPACKTHIQETHTEWANIIQEVLRELRGDLDPIPEIEKKLRR